MASKHSLTIPKKPGTLLAPLSLAQQRLWFIYQLDPKSSAYNISRAWRLKGSLNTQALTTSINLIVARHEALRTTFREIDGQPVQIIEPVRTVTLQDKDFSGSSPDQLDKEIDRFLTEEPLVPFDLLTGPLLRFTLIRCAPDDHVLVFTVHHMVFDGTSLKNFCQELSIFYQTTLAGQPNPVALLPIQYQDFAYWQQEHVTEKTLTSQLAFWKQELHEAPLVLEIPSDSMRPKDNSGPGNVQTFTISPQIISKLKELIQPQGVTMFMALLAVFQVLLTRYTGKRDLLVGTPIAGRTHTDIEPLMGFFVNTLVLRVQLPEQLTFQDILRQVRKTCLKAYRHQGVPFEKLVEVLKPLRDPSRHPIVQTIFQLRQASDLRLTFPELTAHPVPVKKRTGNFDLHMVCDETESGIQGFLYYPQALYSDDSMTRFVKHYQILLEGLIANPERLVRNVPFLIETEMQQQLVEWNHTATVYPKDANLSTLFQAQVTARHDGVAVVSGEEQLTYAQLNARANQLAHYLQRQGVGPEVRVGVCLERGVDLLVSLLAILKAGGAYVPMDPSVPAERLRYIIEDAAVDLVLTQKGPGAGLPRMTTTRMAILAEVEAVLAQESVTSPGVPVSSGQLAYIMYTSGSTGLPKGTLINQRSVVRLIKETNYAKLDAQQRFLQVAPMAFDASTFEVWGSLLNGATLVVYPPGPMSLENLGGMLEVEGISTVWLTAGLFHQMVEQEGVRLSQVAQVLAGGDVLAPKAVRQLVSQMGAGQVINGYGPTENTTFTCYHVLTREKDIEMTVPIGQPISNTQGYVLDQSQQLVPVGVSGEFYVGGEGLAWGYVNQAALTAAQFVPNPYSAEPGARMYKTGDQVRWRQEGVLEFQGRRDTQIKLRGYRIELGEIEATLSEHQAVRDVVAVCREDSPGEKQVVAYVTWVGHDSTSINDLRSFLHQKLPEYMVPTAFVVLDVLPLTANGKVNRIALPAPDNSRENLETAFLKPQNWGQELLTDIWAITLKIPKVGIHDNFFALGGHSLLATQIISQIRSVFSVELPIQALFDHPTVASLSEQLPRRPKEGAEETAKIDLFPRQKILPASFTQERFWILDQLHSQSQGYYVSRGFRLKGRLNDQALQKSFQDIVNRHKILRTTFTSLDGYPQQVITPTLALNIPIIELKNISETNREVAGLQLMEEEQAQPFDLARGPLLRVKLVRFAPQNHLLLLTFHHIICDAWSLEVLHRELSTLYSGYCEEREPSLPPLSLQYSDFTLWQRKLLEGPAGEKELAYWQKILADPPPPLPLPTDYPRGPVQTLRGRRIDCRLPKELTHKLLALKQRKGCTFFMIVLTGLQLLLSRYTGLTDILIGAPIAGRKRPEFERLIGCFLNNLVLRTKISKDLTFSQLLRQVRENVLGALTHQDIPFEQLLDKLHVERNTGRTPLFQILLNMHNFSDKELLLPDVNTSMVITPHIKSLFDWTLYFQEYPDQIHLKLVYNADLFAEPRMLETMNQLQSLLEQVVQDPDLPLEKYSLVTDASKNLLPDPSLLIDEPPQESVCTLFRWQAQAIPGQPAIRQGSRAWTYQELFCQTDALAQTLKKQRLAPGEVVAIGGPRSFGLVVALLAVLQAGGVIMPLDSRLPMHRQRLMRQEAKAKRYLWIGQNLPQDFIGDTEPDVVLHQVEPETGIILDQQPHVEISSALDFLPQPDDPAYLFFTSGSTGSPKGILGQHKSLSHFLTWQSQTFQVGPQDRVAQLTALSFDAVLRDIFLPLISGATLCLPDDQIELDPTKVIPWIDQERITILHTVPTVAQFWLSHVPEKTKLSSLRWTFFSGEPLTDVFMNQWRQTFPESGQLVNFYGPTETTLIKYWFVIPDFPQTGIQPIGYPMSHTQALIVGPDTHLCGIGEVGEIVLRTPFRTLGYINAPSDQRRGFCPNPYRDDPSDLLYWTGDLGRYRLDGSLEILGRRDNQIKIRGVRIEPEEITTILQGHPDLEAAAVLGNIEKDGHNFLVAYVVPKSGISLTEQSIRTFLSSKVPSAMIPSSIVFLDALPFTPNGKLDRRALPVPALTSQNRTTLFVEPRNPIEEELARIWSEILTVDQVGIYDNFFELGGHSLLATQVVARLRNVLELDLPLRTLFEYQTVAQLASEIEAQLANAFPDWPKDETPTP